MIKTQTNYEISPGEGHVTQLKNAGEGHVTQLKSVRPTRPSTAPFASKSLSVHGHLPSFVKRRPQTATVIHQRVNVSICSVKLNINNV